MSGGPLSGFGYLWLKQAERGAFDGECGKAGFRPAGVVLSGIPANAPSSGARYPLAVWPSRPALARYDQEQLGGRSSVRDKAAAVCWAVFKPAFLRLHCPGLRCSVARTTLLCVAGAF